MIPGLVSTIVPVFNRPQQLRAAIASVVSQGHRPLEVIIIDDGSTDETLSVARDLADASPDLIHATTQLNAGPGTARERGRSLAKGEFIQYLDSDDVLLPDKFSAQVNELNRHPECNVAYGMTRFRNADGSVAAGPSKGTGSRSSAMFPSFLLQRWWDTPNPLYRREICDRAGPWTDLRLEEDWEYDCRIAALGARLVWCPQYVCEVRDHDGDRLCRGPSLDPTRLRQRCRSHELILGHALRSGMNSESPELQTFARTLFLLARQCGAAGLSDESRRLFELSRQACGTRRARRLDFGAYQAFARVVGWAAAGKASHWVDQLRGDR